MMEELIYNQQSLALVFKQQAFNLRQAFRQEKVLEKMKDVLLAAWNGLKEMHELGYVHSSLDPSKIVMNQDF